MADLVDQVVGQIINRDTANKAVASGKGDLIDQVIANSAALPPPTPKPPKPAFLLEFGKGAAKGLGRTLINLGSTFDPMGAANYYAGNSAPSAMEQARPEAVELTTPEGGPQKAGFVTEHILEALVPTGASNAAARGIMAGSDLVAGSGRVLAEIPAVASRLGRAAVTAGTEGVTGASVVGAQTGDPEEAAFAGALGGLFRGGLQYFSKPERLRQAATQIIDSTKGLDAKSAGELVQQRIRDVYDAAGQQIGADYGAIILKAGNARVSVRNSLPALKALLKEIEGPMSGAPGAEGFAALGNVDDVRKAASMLRDLVEQYVTKPTGLLNAAGKPITQQVPKELTMEQAIKFRSLLFKLSQSPEFKTTIGEGALKKADQLWHTEITDSLSAVSPKLAKEFEAASGAYRNMIDQFTKQTVRAAVRAGKPELIVDSLMRPGGESSIRDLESFIGKPAMETVRASVWKRMLEQASPTSTGTFLGGQIVKKLDTMSPGLKSALFGGEQNVIKLEKFAEMADTAWLHQLAQASMQKTITKGLGWGAAIGALAWAPKVLDRDYEGRWLYWAAGSTLAVIAPEVLARILVKPGAVDVMTKALSADVTSSVGRTVMARLSELAVEASREATKERVKHGTLGPISPALKAIEEPAPYAADDEAGITNVMNEHAMTREQAIEALQQRGHIQ